MYKFTAYMFRNETNDNTLQSIHSGLSGLNGSTGEASRNTTEILKHLVNDVKSLNTHVMFTDQNLDDFFLVINGILVLC